MTDQDLARVDVIANSSVPATAASNEVIPAMTQNLLVGKTIVAVYLADDSEAIKFVLSNGRDIIASCDGDCCSHTWIEDVLDPEAAIGSEVTSAVDIDLPESLQAPTKTDNYEEEMAFYGFAIETTKGRCTLAYRNSSNGYYGGSLSWPGDYYSGGVHQQNVSSQKWRLLAGEPPPAAAVARPVGDTTT